MKKMSTSPCGQSQTAAVQAPPREDDVVHAPQTLRETVRPLGESALEVSQTPFHGRAGHRAWQQRRCKLYGVPQAARVCLVEVEEPARVPFQGPNLTVLGAHVVRADVAPQIVCKRGEPEE